jgi:hypothetical protein
MNLPRYTVCKVSKNSGMFWAVCSKRKELAVFQTQAEAQGYAQRLVEDDNWHAANR